MLLASSSLSQTTWYVDGQATPPGSGSAAQPFPTVQLGIESARSGDTASVAPGKYRETLDIGFKSLLIRSTRGPDETTVEHPDAVSG